MKINRKKLIEDYNNLARYEGLSYCFICLENLSNAENLEVRL